MVGDAYYTHTGVIMHGPLGDEKNPTFKVWDCLPPGEQHMWTECTKGKITCVDDTYPSVAYVVVVVVVVLECFPTK